MKFITLTTTFLATICLNLLFALPTEFVQLQPKDGLNDGEINSIVQDGDGMMWFATWSGLISYDGYSFTDYTPELGNPKSLPDKKVKKLFVDSKNNLWIATSKYLCRYIKSSNSFQTYSFRGTQPSEVIIDEVHEVNNHLVVHIVDGFYVLPLKEVEHTQELQRVQIIHEGKPASNYYSISRENNHKLFLVANNSSQNESVLFTTELIIDKDKYLLELSDPISLPSIINDMEFINENQCYLATNEGLRVFNLKLNELTDKRIYPNTFVQELFYASNNRLYFSSINPILYYIDLHTGKSGNYQANPYQEGSLQNNKIHTMYEDFSRNLWIGHQGQGLSVLNLNQKAFFTYRHDPFSENTLTSNKVMCFGGDDHNLFIGLRTGGINHIRKDIPPNQNPVFNTVKILEQGKKKQFNHGVWDIQRQSAHLYWVGSDIGLLQLKKSNGEWLLSRFIKEGEISHTVRKIFIDKNNNLWIGATFNGGLFFIPNPAENEEKIYYQYRADHTRKGTLSDNVITSIQLDSKGRFWVGTVHGLNLLQQPYQQIDLSGNTKPQLTFKNYIAYKKDSNNLFSNEINCIFENFDGNMWIGTQGGGINILDTETEMFSHLTMNDGLPSNNVLGILADPMGNLWLSTTKGLVSYNQHTENPSFVYYNVPDGIQGEIFMINSYYKSMDGEMFFGGDNGFTRFYPESIKPDTVKPKLVFTDIKFNQEVLPIGDSLRGRQILTRHINETDKITLPYHHKTFSIGTSALHYQYPRGNEITYKLEGYDPKWKTIPGYYNNIYYSNLPAGKYTLKVKAISSDNQESATTRTLAIEVLKPWYATWFMILIYVMVALGIIGAVFFVIINRQKFAYDSKINQLNIENTESKMAFLTNIAHGLKTPLSLVIAPIDDMANNYKDIRPEWKNHIDLIQRNANYLLKLINQIIDFRKLNAGKLKLYMQKTDIVKIIKDVVWNFNSFENSQQVKVNLDIPYESLFVQIDAQKIEEVLYNLISNAFKHTPRKHQIDVSLSINNNKNEITGNDDHGYLKISILNEGITIQEKDKDKIFERFYKVNDKIEGAGIGLSFSKSLVELHEGMIEVEPLHGKGMAFHVYLPFDDAHNTMQTEDNFQHEIIYDSTKTNGEHEKTEVMHSPVADDVEEDDQKLKIVLVEDNAELRNFLKNVLVKNYACYEACNGEEGIEIIKKIVPDIVISDIIMPEKDGYQLCREIKSSGKTCHIPVILLTAKNSQEQIISGYEIGADAYVTKPFDLNIITSQISRLIKNRELIRKKYQDQNFMVEVSANKLSKDDEFIMNFRNLLEKNISDPNYNVKSLAKGLNVSSTQLYRKIKALTGYSPVEFIRIVKLQKSYELLLQRNNSVKEVCYMSGFNNISYFIKCFRDHFGTTPANLKDKGMVIPEGST